MTKYSRFAIKSSTFRRDKRFFGFVHGYQGKMQITREYQVTEGDY